MSTLKLKDPTLLKSQVLIDGQWRNANNGSTKEVRNPANGELIGLIPNVGEVETQEAIVSS